MTEKPSLFNMIQKKCMVSTGSGMFASRLTTQLKRFFNWRLDPEAGLSREQKGPGKKLSHGQSVQKFSKYSCSVVNYC